MNEKNINEKKKADDWFRIMEKRDLRPIPSYKCIETF